jgi:hypothetical protein
VLDISEDSSLKLAFGRHEKSMMEVQAGEVQTGGEELKKENQKQVAVVVFFK